MDYNIYVTGYVGYEVTKSGIREQLNKCKGKPCNVNISSMGGSVDDALDIYEQFRNHGDVTVYLTGCVASAATIIAMGAKKIIMSKAALILIHKCASPVCSFEYMNEEQIGDFIKNLKQQQQDNQTIDGVIANIYSLRNKKDVKDNLKKMSNSAWLNSSQALEFGLVDEILDDGSSKISNSVINLIQNLGLPAVPTDVTQDIPEHNIVDSEGNPTQSFLQKTVQGLKTFFHNEPAHQNNQMIKTFTNVGTILHVEGFTEDGNSNIALTQDQVKQVDDRLGVLQNESTEKTNTIASLNTQITDLQNKLTTAQNSIAEKDTQINALKAAPGDVTNNGTPAQTEGLTVRDIYNSIKDI